MSQKIYRNAIVAALAALTAAGAAGQTSLPSSTPAQSARSIVVVTTDGTVKHIPLASGAVNAISPSADGSLRIASDGVYSLTLPMADIKRLYLSPDAPSNPFKGTEGIDPVTLPEEITVALGQTITASYTAPDASLLSKLRVVWSFADPTASANDCITLTPDGEITGLKPGTTTLSARWASEEQTVKVTVNNLLLGDANCSGAVDINDVVATVSYILNNPPTLFSTVAADVNNSGTVEIGDVVGIVNIVLSINNKSTSATSLSLAPEAGGQATYMVDADGNLIIDSPTAIGGLDILTAGGGLTAADALRRLSRSQADSADGIHLVAYGSADRYLPAGEHLIGTISGSISGLTLCDPYGRIIPAIDVTLSGIDGIAAGSADTPTEVYNLSGIRVADSPDGLAPGIYIIRQGTLTRKIRVN